MAAHVILMIMGVVLAVGTVAAAVFFHRVSERVVTVAAELAEKTAANEAHLNAQLEDIHMLVNSRLDEALDRIVLLEKRLKESHEAQR